MDPSEIFKRFKQVSKGRIAQELSNAILDDVRNDAVEKILYKHKIIPKKEVDEVAAQKLLEIIKILEKMPIIHPIESDELL